MEQHKQDVDGFLTRLQRRMRLLDMGRALLLLLFFLSLSLSIFGLSVNFYPNKELAQFFLVSISLCGLVAAFWALRYWYLHRSRSHHASRVEERFPFLKGSLLSSIELEQHANKPEFIRKRILQTASEGVRNVRPNQIYSSQGFWGAFAASFSSFVVLLILSILLPIAPLKALASLSDTPIQPENLKDELLIDEKAVQVGDIVLKYTFPAYTKMEPIEVKNSNGTIHAPLETQVVIQARTKESFESALFQVNDAEPIPATLEEGRLVSTSLTITTSGTWRLLFRKGDAVFPSESFMIEVDGDQPPVVTVDSTIQNKVPLNRVLGIRWAAKDDYGIERVVLEFEVNGELKSQVLKRPVELSQSISGRIMNSPSRLGLKSGDKVKLRVVAYDNQPEPLMDGEAPVSNPDPDAPIGKRGESGLIEFTVIGPKLRAKQLIESNKEFKEAMLYILADFLVEKTPPSRRRSGMISWVDVVRKRFQPMQDLIKKHWGNERPSDYSSELIQEVLDIAGRLMRFVLVTYDPNQSGRVTDQDTQTFLELHADEIEALEQAIYLIDLMLRRVAFAEVLKESNRLEKQSEQLQALLNDEDASKEEKLYRMERISSGVERLLESAKDLGNGSMKEFVEARSQEIQSLMEQIREAEANGETEQVESMMEELVENVGELNEGIQEQLQQQQQGEDELMKAYEKLKEELQAQEDAQLELSKQLDEARQQEGEASQELIESWQRLAVLAEDSDTRASGIINNVGGGEGFRSGTIRQYKKQQRTIADLRDAVDARDFAASYSELTRAERMNRSAGGSTHTEVYRQRMSQEKRPEQLQQISQELPIISQNLSEMRSILEQMDTSQAESRAMRELAKQLQQQQQELNQKQKGLEQQAKRIEGALPTADGSVSEFIEQATENMGNAQEALGEGSSVQGEGYQRQGAQNLRNARERLDEQMQQYQQMQQQMRQMGGEGDGSSEQESSEQSGDDIDIPLPDEHMTPEEYRKALLEGMKGKVPEEYQTLKKRYYEELVQQ